MLLLTYAFQKVLRGDKVCFKMLVKALIKRNVVCTIRASLAPERSEYIFR